MRPYPSLRWNQMAISCSSQLLSAHTQIFNLGRRCLSKELIDGFRLVEIWILTLGAYLVHYYYAFIHELETSRAGQSSGFGCLVADHQRRIEQNKMRTQLRAAPSSFWLPPAKFKGHHTCMFDGLHNRQETCFGNAQSVYAPQRKNKKTQNTSRPCLPLVA